GRHTISKRDGSSVVCSSDLHAGTGFDVSGLLQKDCCRRSFGYEAETSVCVNSDHYRDDQIALICCSCIELFCKLYDVYSVLSKSRTYRRSRGCLTSRNL